MAGNNIYMPAVDRLGSIKANKNSTRNIIVRMCAFANVQLCQEVACDYWSTLGNKYTHCGGVTTVTVSTPIRPILTCLRPS